MPRYSYYCDSCESISSMFHSMDTVIEECPLCLQKEYFHKMVSKPRYNLKVEDEAEPKEKVEKHIEDAQRELNKQKRDMRTEDMLDK